MDRHDLFAKTIDHYLAPVRDYLADPTVSEIMVNRADEIFVERDGRLERTDARFSDQQTYEAAVRNILQFTEQIVSEDRPLIDSRLPDGSRVHVARAPCARFGTAMTIRKFSRSMRDLDWLIELGTLSEQSAHYLRTAITAERNILVAGGTSSGKTSLLNALSRFVPEGQRIVVIEDSAELQLQQEHVISLETRPPDRYGRYAVGIRELFRSSLRLRPDRIIIGEVRGAEAMEMIQAMTSGHGGSMGTLHANNPRDAMNRLETMAMMSQVELPLHALRAQICSAIDVIVQMNRQIGGRRVVTFISEVEPLGDRDAYALRDMFTLAQESDAPGAGSPPEPGIDAAALARTAEDVKQLSLQWTGSPSIMAGRLTPDVAARLHPSIAPLFETAGDST